jgi:hypothetical protein
MTGAAEHAIKVFGETDNQVVGLNGAIKTNPVMAGGKKDKRKTRGGKDKRKTRGGKSRKNRSSKRMRGGK